jgi:hypothetical protein
VVPESPDDEELSKLRRAAEFMRDIRLAQSESGKAQTGGNHLSPEQQQGITKAASSSALVAAIKESAGVDLPVNHLGERFAEMCRRQGEVIPAGLRGAVVKLLAAELWVNHKALDEPAEKLISATLHQGAVGPDLLKEFSQHPRWVVATAMKNAPAASRDFLLRAGKEVETLAGEREFQGVAKTRLYEAALRYPSHVRSALRERVKPGGYWARQEVERKTDETPRQPRL